MTINGIRAFMSANTIDRRYEEDFMKRGDWDTFEIFDDSGSMSLSMGKEYDHTTRWDHVKTNAITEIVGANLLDKNGVDCCFLNRRLPGGQGSAGSVNIKDSPEDVEKFTRFFSSPPAGGTPLMTKIECVVQDIMPNIREGKKTQIRVHTDGIPDEGKESLGGWFKERYIPNPTLRENVAFSFILPLNPKKDADAGIVRYYQDSIDELRNPDGSQCMVDVVLPYGAAKERAEIQNPGFKYTKGVHFMKSFVGSTNPAIDRLGDNGGANVRGQLVMTDDVRAILLEEKNNKGCCSIS